ERRVPVVLPVQAVDRNAARPRELEQVRVLLAAADAPRGPHVEQRQLAREVVAADLALGLLEARQAELRRRLTDERRRDVARVEVETAVQEASEHRDEDERNRVAPHVQCPSAG